MSDVVRASQPDVTTNNPGSPGFTPWPWGKLTVLWVVFTDAVRGLDSESLTHILHLATIVLITVPTNVTILTYLVDHLTEGLGKARKAIDGGWRRLRKLRKAAGALVKSLFRPFLPRNKGGKKAKSRKTNHLHARAGKPTR